MRCKGCQARDERIRKLEERVDELVRLVAARPPGPSGMDAMAVLGQAHDAALFKDDPVTEDELRAAGARSISEVERYLRWLHGDALFYTPASLQRAPAERQEGEHDGE